MRYEEYVNIQLEKIKKAGFISSDDMPELDLYIDQAETFFKGQIADLDGESAKKLVTKAMINNYAKHDMIARPDGKKYTKDHLAMIAMVLYLKGMFKMEEIEYLMQPLVENYSSEFDDPIDPVLIYRTAENINEGFADDLIRDVDDDIDLIKRLLDDTDIADDEQMEVFILILSMAMRANAEKYLASRLLETYFINPQREKPEKIKKQKKSAEEKNRAADK